MSDLPNSTSSTDWLHQHFSIGTIGFLLTECYQLWQRSVNIGSMRNNMWSQLGKNVYQTKLLAQLNIWNSSSIHVFVLGKCIVLKQPYWIVYSLLSQKKRKTFIKWYTKHCHILILLIKHTTILWKYLKLINTQKFPTQYTLQKMPNNKVIILY